MKNNDVDFIIMQLMLFTKGKSRKAPGKKNAKKINKLCAFAFFACPKASAKDSFRREFHSGEREKQLLNERQ